MAHVGYERIRSIGALDNETVKLATKRPRKLEQAVEWEQAERRVWNEFRPKLAAVKIYAEAQLLVRQTPPMDSPGRRYYSNLGHFLGNFTVPGGSNREERMLYLEFIQRLVAAGEVKPEDGEMIQAVLRRAMSERIG